jgi:hypothetical protein
MQRGCSVDLSQQPKFLVSVFCVLVWTIPFATATHCSPTQAWIVFTGGLKREAKKRIDKQAGTEEQQQEDTDLLEYMESIPDDVFKSRKKHKGSREIKDAVGRLTEYVLYHARRTRDLKEILLWCLLLHL